MYPVLQPIVQGIRNPAPENVERFHLNSEVEHHFEAFGVIILKIRNPEGHEAFWAYGKNLGLPPIGDTVPLIIDRLQVPLVNGYFFLFRASNDSKAENSKRLNELYQSPQNKKSPLPIGSELF